MPTGRAGLQASQSAPWRSGSIQSSSAASPRSAVTSSALGAAGRSGINAGSAGNAASLSAASAATTAGQRGRLTPTRLGTPPSLAASTPLGARSSMGLSAISSSRSATVPAVGAAATSNFNSSTVPNLAQSASYGRPYWSHGCSSGYYGGYYGYPYYGYGYPYYGHCGYPGFGFYAYPFAFGFGFSVSFGYPYGGYPYGGYYSPYAYGAYCYPYAGYYYGYPYSYLNDYGCDFYDGYYVRFGYARASYYVACSGYGCHGYDHHCHHYACSSHGDHVYHVRDCPECYPSGSLTYEVDVPDEAIAGATPQVESREISPPDGEVAASEPLEPKEAFLAGLKPAQLSFVMGLDDLRKGNYEDATESLYSASLEDPESRLVKVFLATSLFSVGEHGYAAEYLRLGLDGWDAFPSYSWDVRDAYGVPGDFDRHMAALEEEVRTRPGDADRLLVLGFLKTHSGQPEGAASAFESLQAVSTDPVDDALAERYVAEIEDRNGTFPRDPSEAARLAADEEPAVQAFLASQSVADVPALPIR